jgi:tetratricopeptide (TPR) repeat protein
MKKAEKTIIPSLDELEHKIMEGEAKKVVDLIVMLFLGNEKNINSEIKVDNAQYFRLLSVAYKEIGDFKSSKESTLEVLNYFELEKNKEGKADCLLNLSVINRHLSEYNDSIKNLSQATKIFEELGLMHKVAKCEQTLGLLYYFLEYFDEAEIRVKKAQKIYAEALIGNKGNELREKYIKLGMISCMHLLGIVIFDGGGKGNSLKYLEEAKDEAEKISKSRLRGYIYQDLGRYYLSSNRVDTKQAEEYIQKSEKIRKDLNDKRGMAICLLHYGILESKDIHWQEAIEFYLKAEKLADTIKADDIRINSFEKLYEAHKMLRNNSEAFFAIDSFMELKKRESEKKRKNRVELEDLLPVNDTIKGLISDREKLHETIDSTAITLELIYPPNQKSLKHKRINEAIAAAFENNRKGLRDKQYEYKVPSVKRGLEYIKEILIGGESKRKLFWRRGKEHFIGLLYDQLIAKQLIFDCGREHFKNIICNENNNFSNEYIKWIGKLNHFTFLINFLEEAGLLDPDFREERFVYIKSKFKKGDLNFTNALNTAFSNMESFLASDKKADENMKKYYETMKKLVDDVVKG